GVHVVRDVVEVELQLPGRELAQDRQLRLTDDGVADLQTGHDGGIRVQVDQRVAGQVAGLEQEPFGSGLHALPQLLALVDPDAGEGEVRIGRGVLVQLQVERLPGAAGRRLPAELQVRGRAGATDRERGTGGRRGAHADVVSDGVDQ